jgi:hypothetical protein
MLERAFEGTEAVTIREDGVTTRHAVSPNLSMAVLNRLDRFALARDDQDASVARRIAADFDGYILLVHEGGDEADVRAFLAAHADPLAPPVAVTPEPLESPKLVDESAIFAKPTPRQRPIVRPDLPLSPAPEPCACPADRAAQLLEPV